MSLRTILISALLLIILAASQWVVETSDPAALDIPKESHNADFFLENFTNTIMDAEGKPYRRLTADRMLHFPDDDSTELSNPYIILFVENLPLWEIRSESGWLSGDGSLLLLNGPATLDRAASPAGEQLNIITSNLRLQPENNYAETDEPITVKTRGSTVKSVGMQAWFSHPSRIKFLTKAKGHYAVN
jgi:lipopolysaccharide export system protein LptC